MEIKTKSLGVQEFAYADGKEVVEKFSVHKDGKRVGTIHKVTYDDVTWFEPFFGSKRGGKIVTVNHMIQLRCNFVDALKVITDLAEINAEN